MSLGSGMNLSNAALADYQNFSQKKQSGTIQNDAKEEVPAKLTYVIFYINGKEVATETSGLGPLYKPSEQKAEIDKFPAVFAEFSKKLVSIKEPRYGAIDMHTAHADGRFESKIVVFRWSPESAPTRLKMSYTATEGAFKAKINAAKIYQANDAADVTLEAFSKTAF